MASDITSPPDRETGALSNTQVREATFHGVRWFGMSAAVVQIVNLCAAVVLARLISPADFGRLAVAVVVSEFSLMTANETIGTPLVQRSDVTRKHLECATLLGIVTGVGLALLTLFVAPLVATPVFGKQTSDLFRLFAPQFVLTGLMIVPQARLQRELRFRRIGLSEAAGTVVASVASVALAFAGLGAAAYVLGMLIGVLIMALGYITGGRPVMPRWHRKQMRELLGFGLPSAAAGFAGVTYRNVDYMILGARLPSVIVGFYYRAFTLGVEYERRLSGVIARIVFPVYTRTEDAARRMSLRLRIVRVNVVLVYPMLALFIALAPTLMPWVFGPHWIPAVLPAQILAVAGMASCVRNLHAPTVLAAGRPKALFAFCCAETVLYAATVWVASSYGLTVVCVTVSGFQVASLVIAYTVLLRAAVGMPRTQLFRDLGPAVLASAPLLLVAMAIRRALDGEVPVFVVLAVASAAGGATYLIALRALSKEAWSDVVLLAQRVLPGVERLGRPPRPGRMSRRQSAPETATPAPGRASALNELTRAGINGTAEAQPALALAEIETMTSSPAVKTADRGFDVVRSPEG
jgi:lipopolysaccharide exporter